MANEFKYAVIIQDEDNTYSILDLIRPYTEHDWIVYHVHKIGIPTYEEALLILISNVTLFDTSSTLDNIVSWGKDRGIIEHTNARTLAQLSKTMEEIAELIAHLADPNATIEQIADDYGDIMVTLIMGMSCQRIPAEAALHLAYQEIRNRKGKMIDGKFVKEAQ